MFGTAILVTGNEIKQNAQALENPESLQSYHDTFPSVLRDFFYGMVNSILQQKFEVAEKKTEAERIST